MSRKPVAYGKEIIGRRKLGERIGLLVVGLHDWNAGLALCSKPGVARVIVAEDDLPHELDFSCAVGLDCLIVGDCDERVFYAAATMLYAAGAASIWGEYPDGAWRLERWSSKCCPEGFYAADGPFSAGRLARALSLHRDWALMTAEGVYGTAAFAPARLAVFQQAFAHMAERAMGWVDEQRGIATRRAA